jgi:hypothetical protein
VGLDRADGAKRTVDDSSFLNQVPGSMTSTIPNNPCPCPCGSLILLHIVNQRLEATIHAAMVKIEAKPPDLKRFTIALVLSGVDARAEGTMHSHEVNA